MIEDFYEYGKQCRKAFTESKQYAQFDNDLDPKAVMTLFMHRVDEGEMPMQMTRPLPKSHLDWLKGYKGEAR